jgi:hypothetical protein
MWWNLSSRVNRAKPRSKSSHHAQPAGPCGSLYILRLHGPTECEFRGDELRFLALKEIEEPFEGRGWFLEFCPEGASKRYILPEFPAQGFHRAPPRDGQACAVSSSVDGGLEEQQFRRF